MLPSVSQAIYRSVNVKRMLVRTYFATPTVHFTKNNTQRQEEIQPQNQSHESTVYINHEGADSDSHFTPTINHVFDD
ncbi:hypothetical protein BY458DRAFT_511954 [Sporodiniella umbellata]|nr:hypothetical protein BY458DRAFT_511954 [Sporodiniella umbellata]